MISITTEGGFREGKGMLAMRQRVGLYGLALVWMCLCAGCGAVAPAVPENSTMPTSDVSAPVAVINEGVAPGEPLWWSTSRPPINRSRDLVHRAVGGPTTGLLFIPRPWWMRPSIFCTTMKWASV